MSQQRVQHARSSIAGAVPAAVDVKVGEIIINLADRTLRTKNGANALIRINQNIPITNIAPDDPQSGDWYLTTSGQIIAYGDFGAGVIWRDIAPPEDLSGHLLKTGGVMTGQITLPGGGAGNQAATVTEATALAAAAVVPALLKAGGVMTGHITLIAGAAGLQAVSVTQMDAAIAAAIPPDLSGVLLKTGGVMTGQITLPGGGAGNQAASINELAASIAAHAAQPDPHADYALSTELVAALAAHVAAADPHAGYTLSTELNAHIGAGGAAHANVTGAVAGFMSAADKVILNGLPALIAAVGVFTEYNKGGYAINGTFVQAHGLGSIAAVKKFEVWLKVVTAFGGWAVGTYLKATTLDMGGSGVNTQGTEAIEAADVVYATSSALPAVVPRAGGSPVVIVAANVEVIFRVYP